MPIRSSTAGRTARPQRTLVVLIARTANGRDPRDSPQRPRLVPLYVDEGKPMRTAVGATRFDGEGLRDASCALSREGTGRSGSVAGNQRVLAQTTCRWVADSGYRTAGKSA